MERPKLALPLVLCPMVSAGKSLLQRQSLGFVFCRFVALIFRLLLDIIFVYKKGLWCLNLSAAQFSGPCQTYK